MLHTLSLVGDSSCGEMPRRGSRKSILNDVDGLFLVHVAQKVDTHPMIVGTCSNQVNTSVFFREIHYSIPRRMW